MKVKHVLRFGCMILLSILIEAVQFSGFCAAETIQRSISFEEFQNGLYNKTIPFSYVDEGFSGFKAGMSNNAGYLVVRELDGIKLPVADEASQQTIPGLDWDLDVESYAFSPKPDGKLLEFYTKTTTEKPGIVIDFNESERPAAAKEGQQYVAVSFDVAKPVANTDTMNVFVCGSTGGNAPIINLMDTDINKGLRFYGTGGSNKVFSNPLSEKLLKDKTWNHVELHAYSSDGLSYTNARFFLNGKELLPQDDVEKNGIRTPDQKVISSIKILNEKGSGQGVLLDNLSIKTDDGIPAIQAPTLTGDCQIGQPLTLQYTFEGGTCGAPEDDKSEIEWLISDAETGPYTALEVMGKEIVVLSDWAGKFIKARIIPKNGTGNTGTADETRPVQISGQATDLPAVSELSIDRLIAGQTATLSYRYEGVSPEDLSESGTKIIWYTVNETGEEAQLASGKTVVLPDSSELVGRKIKVTVQPKNLEGLIGSVVSLYPEKRIQGFIEKQQGFESAVITGSSPLDYKLGQAGGFSLRLNKDTPTVFSIAGEEQNHFLKIERTGGNGGNNPGLEYKNISVPKESPITTQFLFSFEAANYSVPSEDIIEDGTIKRNDKAVLAFYACGNADGKSGQVFANLIFKPDGDEIVLQNFAGHYDGIGGRAEVYRGELKQSEWHTAKIVLDPMNACYDVWIDGSLVCRGLAPRLKTEDITEMRVENQSYDCTACIDDWSVFCGEAEQLGLKSAAYSVSYGDVFNEAPYTAENRTKGAVVFSDKQAEAVVTYENSSLETERFILIGVSRDSAGNLIDIAKKNMSVDSGESAEETLALQVKPLEGGQTLTIYRWDSESGLRPLSKMKRITSYQGQTKE